MEDCINMLKLPAALMQAKILIEAVVDFILKDIRPLSGLTRFFNVAELRYTAPCRKTVMGFID